MKTLLNVIFCFLTASHFYLFIYFLFIYLFYLCIYLFCILFISAPLFRRYIRQHRRFRKICPVNKRLASVNISGPLEMSTTKRQCLEFTLKCPSHSRCATSNQTTLVQTMKIKVMRYERTSPCLNPTDSKDNSKKYPIII